LSEPPITVYSASWCPYCQRAKTLLRERGLAFTEIDVDEDPDRRAQMIARSGRRTIPQIFVGDRHIGGCDELYDSDRSGELGRLIQGDR